MSQTPLYGASSGASVTTSGFGCHANAFTFSMAQGVTGYFGFGDIWMTNYGTIASWSGTIAGFTTQGTSTDTPVAAAGLAPITTRAGVSITLTWATGSFMTGTAIVSDTGLSVTFLGTDSSVYSFVGTGAPSLTWVVA